MKKIICLLAITFYALFGFNYCNAAKKYYEELFMPIGSYFSLDTNNEVYYSISGNNAKVVRTERGKEVYLHKLGKVLVQAKFYINGSRKKLCNQKYLINIVPLTD